MIVTIHPSVANRYPTLDPDFRIQVFPAKGVPAYKVKGNQLIAAGMHTRVSTGRPFLPDHWYFMALKDVRPVCYDCVSFNSKAKLYHPLVDMTYVLRVQEYDEDGYPMLLTDEVVRVLHDSKAHRFSDKDRPWLVAINPTYVKFH